MDVLDHRIDLWKSRLLDLSQRNRLLYFKPSKYSTVSLLGPPVDVIFTTLVVKERALTFPRVIYTSATAPDGTQRGSSGDQESPNFRVIPGNLDVDVDARELQRRLYRLRRDSSTAIQEQGVHTLFVACGLLRWASNGSGEECLSPIILIPVQLVRQADDKPYQLELADEEVQLNPTLNFVLTNDFGIRLPGLPDEVESLNVNQYLSSVQRRVGSQGWQVLREAWLGRFSFEKLVIYTDLENHRKQARDHPIVSAIAGASDLPEPSNGFSLDDLDELMAVPEAFPVLDADASQIETLLRIRSGENLVVYGPPGTGKSQTIANIIAQALRDGKKVLFVSEKMAALEVVDRRLREVGLAPAVLEVHSHRANKRAVIEELGRTLFRDRSSWTETVDLEFEELRRTVTQLNEYVRELHRPRDSEGRSAYQVIGRLALLDDVPYVDFDLPFKDVLDTPRDQYLETLGAIKELVAVPEVVNHYNDHPFRGWKIEVFDAEERNRVRRLLTEFRELVAGLKLAVEEFDKLIGEQLPSTAKGAESRAALAGHFATMPRIHLGWLSGRNLTGLERVRGVAEEVRRKQERYQFLSRNLESVAGLGLAHLPVHDLRSRFTTEYRGRFRILNARYRADMRTVRKVWSAPKKPRYRNVVDALDLAEQYLELEEWLESERHHLMKLFGPLFGDWQTDWEAVQAALDWVDKLITLAGSGGALRLPSLLADHPDLTQQARGLQQRLRCLLEDWDQYEKQLSAVASPEAMDDLSPGDMALSELLVWLEAKLEALPRLSEFTRFLRAKSRCDKAGLSSFVEQILARRLRAEECESAFLRRYFTAWLAASSRNTRALSEFSGPYRKQLIQSFKELDRNLLRLSARLTLAEVERQQPRPASATSSAASQMGTLLREVQKRKRHMPLRRLFAETPQLLQALKPCLLMSPLSVSAYLPKIGMQFDLVVFDEASQIPPWDAICSILRGKQLVVAGDDKQLPPTTFFQVDMDDDYDEDTGPDNAPLESILDECAAIPSFGKARLKWHYRSRREGLIAFSNREFYDGELITFPAPSARDRSVRFEYTPNGIYDRGASRTNRIEARRVAELVIEHFEKYGFSQSLGVIALSVAQENAIDEELMRIRPTLPHLEPFFAEDPEGIEEPFFVKNLENVQGDERDRIIISIGYARDANGVLSLNFGPINRAGGERRLNVAITRARWETTVVCSFLPYELDLTRLTTRNIGVGKLQAYLEYAYRGEFVSEAKPSTAETNEFEEAVRRALEREGLTVDAQVGCSGFRIDLAIRHPDVEGRYILGIECDGVQYHRSKTARDRDRLRQEVLERLGWNILRIWSYDWISDPEAQVRRVIDAVERLRTLPVTDISLRTAPVAGPDEAGGAPVSEGSQTAEIPGDLSVPRLQLPAYVEYKPPVRKPKELFYDAQRLATVLQMLADDIGRIVQVESPIHRHAAVRRLAAIYEIERAGNQVARIADRAIAAADDRKLIKVRGDFLWDVTGQSPNPRRRIDGSEPPIDEIATEELAAGMTLVLASHFGMEEDDLITETARVFGYDRTGERVRNRLKDVVRSLLRAKRIHRSGAFLTMAAESD